MNKTRVYELAQKLGVDNKEIIARLKSIGIEVKNHMAVLDEDTVKKLSEPAAVKEVSQEEVRVKPTLIRRRPKVVEEPIVAKPEVPTAEEKALPAVEMPEVGVKEERAPDDRAASKSEPERPNGVFSSPVVEFFQRCGKYAMSAQFRAKALINHAIISNPTLP